MQSRSTATASGVLLRLRTLYLLSPATAGLRAIILCPSLIKETGSDENSRVKGDGGPGRKIRKAAGVGCIHNTADTVII